MFTVVKVRNLEDSVEYLVDDRPVQLENLGEVIRYNMPRHMEWRSVVFIMADHDVPMKAIKDLHRSLYIYNLLKVAYVTKRPPPEFTSRFDLNGLSSRIYFTDEEITAWTEEEGLPPPPPPPPVRPEIDFSKYRLIDVHISDHIVFDGQRVSDWSLVDRFMESASKNTIFNYIYTDSLPLQQYITVFGAHKEAIHELREAARRVHPKSEYHYSDELDEEMDRLRDLYPLMYVENQPRESKSRE